MISPRVFLLFCGLLAMATASGSVYPYSSQYNYQPYHKYGYQNYGYQPSSYQYNYQQFPYQYNYKQFPYQYNYQQFPYQYNYHDFPYHYNYQQFPYQNFENDVYQPLPYGGPVDDRFPWGFIGKVAKKALPVVIPAAIDFLREHI